MVAHNSKTLQQILQDFLSISDHFETLYIEGVKNKMLGLTFVPATEFLKKI